MNVRCWNCGNDQEVAVDQEREQVKESIIAHLQSLADTYANTGFVLRAEVFDDAMRFVRSFRL